MTIEYVSSQGDTVDYIAWKHYGNTEEGVVEAIFEANPGLAKQPAELSPGIIIILPEVVTPEPQEMITLWT